VVTAPSRFLAEAIENISRVPVLIVPNIVDTEAFRFRSRVPLRPRLLVCRHLENMYDIPSVLKAFRNIQQQHQDASLWIAGTGSEEGRLKKLAADWHLENVRFLGHVAHSGLPGIYDQCDIMVNASLVDNFPGALIEASAAGMPVVSTSPGGIPFIFKDGTTALLVKPGDWQGLAAGVTKLLQYPTLAAELVRNAAALAAGCRWTEIRKALYLAYGDGIRGERAAGAEHCAAESA
jgi:phenylacetate-CoA ligase